VPLLSAVVAAASPGVGALAAGAVSVMLASFLGGVTGFGYALVATPLLLLAGFSLPFVITANLTLALVTRVSIAYRFRAAVTPRRVAALVLGSVPGLWIGTRVLTTVDASAIKLAAGVLVMVVAVVLARSLGAPPPRPVRGAPVAAGFAGGFLGATTSLNGVAPVLLLARDKAAPRSFIADLAVYFVASNAIALLVLAAGGAVSHRALFPAALLWLPGSLLGNLVGSSLGPRLPERAFRRLTLVIVFVAGGLTALSA
jgi:uncharacterized membrane protein YfcA